MSNQFISKIATWLADKLIVDGLAKTAGFQRFAQKTHSGVQQAKAKVKSAPTAIGESSVFQEMKAAKAELQREIQAAKDQLKREIEEANRKQ